MATRIRLARGGRKKAPYYRIVVADKRAPRDGKFVERIGSYNPILKEKTTVLDVERVQYWLGHGAKATETVQKLLVLHGFKFGKEGRLESFSPVAEVSPKPEKASQPSAKSVARKAAADAAPAEAAAPKPVAEAAPEAPVEVVAPEPMAEAAPEAPAEAAAPEPVAEAAPAAPALEPEKEEG